MISLDKPPAKKENDGTVHALIIIVAALIGLVCFGYHHYRTMVDPTTNQDCYRLLTADYANEKNIIDDVMSDNVLTQPECDRIRDGELDHYYAELRAQNQEQIKQYQRLRAGQKIEDTQ